MRVVPVNAWPRDLELVKEGVAGRHHVLRERRAVARVGELDAVPVNAGRMRDFVAEVHDHRVADLEPELGAGNSAVKRQHADIRAGADIHAGGLRDDLGLDDVRIGVDVVNEGNRVWAVVRHGEGGIVAAGDEDHNKSNDEQRTGNREQTLAGAEKRTHAYLPSQTEDTGVLEARPT